MSKGQGMVSLLLLTLLAAGCTVPSGSPLSPAAPGTLAGTLYDERSGVPLRGATLRVGGEEVVVAEGEYQLTGLAPGRYQVEAEARWHRPVRFEVEVRSGTTVLDVPLEPVFERGELELLARLVRAEAEGEVYEGQVAVAASVLNRVASPEYPATISGVIYQVVDGRYWQYTPVLDGRIHLPPLEGSWRAVYDAVAGWDPSEGATGFYNPAKTQNPWVRSQPKTVTIGSHVFFRHA